MREPSRNALEDLLARSRQELVEAATTWVIEESFDLRGARPRDETARLVERVLAVNEAWILQRDDRPLDAFIEHVTSLRAASEFRISTLLRGFASFRHALEELLRKGPFDSELSFELLAAADDAYLNAICRLSDLYIEKLNHTIIERRAALEIELSTKISTIDAQREMLAQLASPVIRLWEGVVVLPIVGEVGPDRVAPIMARVLDTVTTERARHLIIDLTGLTGADTHAAFALLQTVRAARLLGASGTIVGISADIAQTFVSLDLSLEGTPTFATLGDGLRAALASEGYAIVRHRHI